MGRIILICIGLLFVQSVNVSGQFNFQHSTLQFTGVEGELTLATAGGINSAQYNPLDLNGDAVQDLLIFDRSSNKLSTFIYQDGVYEYAPEYEAFFPQDLVSWMLLRDYDCDGDLDLFTDAQLGLRVFENLGNFPPSWELTIDPLPTLGSRIINLFFNDSDIPVIEDLDGDGDLDILAYNFATGETIDFHQNLSFDNTNACGLDFVRITRNYGDIHECDCGVLQFGEVCFPNGRRLHVGGKALLALDLDNDQDLELLAGEETCGELNLLTNQGNPSQATFNSVENFLTDIGVNEFVFPAAYQLDIDKDGNLDLMLSTNLRDNSEAMNDLTSSSIFLRNTTNNLQPQYTLQSISFLQNQMVDVGENAHPALFDIDGDGDLDLFIGGRTIDADGQFIGTITHFENSGNATEPSFIFRTSDFQNLSSLRLEGINPQFVDMTDDGIVDLVVTGITLSDFNTRMILIPGTNQGFLLNQTSVLTDIPAIADNPTLYDVNSDGINDLLVGRRVGTLELYVNLGSNSSPVFELQQSAFLDISTSIERINLVPLVSDVNSDGHPDLITTDGTGEVTVYDDFLRAPEPNRMILSSSLNQDLTSTKVGRLTWPAVGNLTGSTTDLLIGTVSGGILSFRDTLNSQIINPQDIALEIFPNPVVSNDFISIRSNSVGEFEIIDITGKVFATSLPISINQSLQIDTSILKSGVFLIRFRSLEGTVVTKRFIVKE